MTTVDVHAEAQEWERDWWGDCTNTFSEEVKQLTYAHCMGLVSEQREGHWPVYDLQGASVLDLGGGPASMLLKTINGGERIVVDPCPYPAWTTARYLAAGIRDLRVDAEAYEGPTFDECWIYNVLQHVVDPLAVIDTARRHARRLRIFEWLETETNIGHLHTLHADMLNEWLGGTGTVQVVKENACHGLAYYGVFDLRLWGPDDSWIQAPPGTPGPTGVR